MNKDNPTPIASQDPIAKANEKLMEAIAKDLKNTQDKSISEVLYATGAYPEEPQSWWDWFWGNPKKPILPSGVKYP
jgi:hypothetical protein